MRRTLLLVLAGGAAVHALPIPTTPATLTPAQIEAGCTLEQISWHPECQDLQGLTTTRHFGDDPAPDPIIGCDMDDDTGELFNCHIGRIPVPIDWIIEMDWLAEILRMLLPNKNKSKPPEHTHIPTVPGTPTQTSPVPTSPPTTTASPVPTSPVPTTTTSPVPTSPPTTTTSSVPTSPPTTTTSPVPTSPPTTTTSPVPTSPVPTSPPTTTTSPVPTSPPTTTTSPVPTSPVPTSPPTTTTSPVPTSPAPTSSPSTTRSPVPTSSPTTTRKPVPTSRPTTTGSPVPPSPTPTHDPNRNVTDLIRTLHEVEKDNKALKIGLGVGIGVGIPAAVGIGWVANALRIARGVPELASVLSEGVPQVSVESLGGSGLGSVPGVENVGSSQHGSGNSGQPGSSDPWETVPDDEVSDPVDSTPDEEFHSAKEYQSGEGDVDEHTESGDDGRPDDVTENPDERIEDWLDEVEDEVSRDEGQDQDWRDEVQEEEPLDEAQHASENSGPRIPENMHDLDADTIESAKELEGTLEETGYTSEQIKQLMDRFRADCAEVEAWAKTQQEAAQGAAPDAGPESGGTAEGSFGGIAWHMPDPDYSAASDEGWQRMMDEGFTAESGGTSVFDWAAEAAAQVVGGVVGVGGATTGGVAGAIDSMAAQMAADVATSGAGAGEVIDALISAGVPAGHAQYTSQVISHDIKMLPEAGPSNAARNAALKIISKAVTPQGMAISEAATTAMGGHPGKSVADALREAGVPEDAVDKTIKDVKAAYDGAAGKPALQRSAAVINAISNAFPPDSAETSSGGLRAPNQDLVGKVARALVNAAGTSYNFWHVYPSAVYHVLKNYQGKESPEVSETLSKILDNGPPPQTGSWWGITFPFQRLKIQGHHRKVSPEDAFKAKWLGIGSANKTTDKPTDKPTDKLDPTEIGFCGRLTDDEMAKSFENDGKAVSDSLALLYDDYGRPGFLARLRRVQSERDTLLKAVPIAICSMYKDPESIRMTPPGTMEPKETLRVLLSLWNKLLKIKRDGNSTTTPAPPWSQESIPRIGYCWNLTDSMLDMAQNMDVPSICRKIGEAVGVNKTYLEDWARHDPATFDTMRTHNLPTLLCGLQAKVTSKSKQEMELEPLTIDENRVNYAYNLLGELEAAMSDLIAAGVGSDVSEHSGKNMGDLNRYFIMAPKLSLPHGRLCEKMYSENLDATIMDYINNGGEFIINDKETDAENAVVEAARLFKLYRGQYLWYMELHPDEVAQAVEVVDDAECRLHYSLTHYGSAPVPDSAAVLSSLQAMLKAFREIHKD